MKARKETLYVLLLFLSILGSDVLFGAIKIRNINIPLSLTVNLRERPIGIDSNPNFSWDAQVKKQTAYQIVVASSLGELKAGNYMWNTGKVNSSKDSQVCYDGKALRSATRYYWQVHVWDEKNKESVSQPSWWETGLLNKEAWKPAKWIGGRQPQDHNWTDMTAIVKFRITDTKAGIEFLFHAEPIGKTWGESYIWKINSVDDVIQLELTTTHYAGNTGVPEPGKDDTPIEWGVNYFDPQSVTNPRKVGTRKVRIATLCDSELGGINQENLLTQDHELKVKVVGNTITTWIDEIQVDHRTLSGDQLRKNGSIGFSSGSNAIVRSVRVEVPDKPVGNGSKKGFFTDFRRGFNPFEDGIIIWTGINGNKEKDGLILTNGKGIMLPIANPAPLLRKEFAVTASPIKSARLYITGGGYPSVTINGYPMTTDGQFADKSGFNIPRLTPDDGQSESFILYNTFDVTRFIETGATNAIGIELGRGWTGVTVPSEWYWNLIPTHADPRTKVKLIIVHEDGSQEIIVSDGTWKTTDGPTLFESVYTGEKYDARKAKKLGKWQLIGYNDKLWDEATILNPMGSYYGTGKYHGLVPATGELPDGFVESKLKSMENEPIVVREMMKPVQILETYPGSRVYLFKFNQMHSGWVKLHLKNVKPEQAGLTLRMRADNIISGRGTKEDPYTLSDSKQFIAGSIQTDYYVLSDDAEQKWSPKFHYNGQGAIEVHGLYNVLEREPDIEWDSNLIVAEVASSGFPVNQITTSNDLLNRIFSMCQWSMLNNAHGHPTDTPSREKNGWTGDGWADAEAWMINFDVSQFYRLWVRDMVAGMNPEGDLNVVMPAPRAYGHDDTPGWKIANGVVPAWDHAFFEIPYDLYRYYGDISILEEIYPMQEKFLNYYLKYFKKEKNYAYRNSLLGEYATGKLGMGNTVNINHQLYYRMVSYMAQVATILGYGDDAKTYQALADEILRAFIRTYWDESTHSFQKGSSGNLETEQILAVAFDMVPGNDVPKNDPKYLAQTTNSVEQNKKSCMEIVANSIQSNNNQIGVGIYGLHYLFNLLNEYGYTNLTYSVATGLENPSWGNILYQEGTTLQEQWGGIAGNHHYHSSLVTWFYQGLAGIKSTSPGYQTIRIKPYIPTIKGNGNLNGEQIHLTNVEASINTPRGLVQSAWRNEKDFTLSVTIPNNTLAEVWIPSASGKLKKKVKRAIFLRQEKGYVVYQVGAGNWDFVANPIIQQ